MKRIYNFNDLKIGDYYLTIEKNIRENVKKYYYCDIEYVYFEQIINIENDGHYKSTVLREDNNWYPYSSWWDFDDYIMYKLDEKDITALMI